MTVTLTGESRRAAQVFRRHGGMLRTSAAMAQGISPRALYQLRSSGVIESVARGLYRLTSLGELADHDLAIVGMKIPDGVVCLVSALAFHGITTQIPHVVYVARRRGAEASRLKHPPVKTVWFSGAAFDEGSEEHHIDGVPVQVYSPEKTLADCFKYRRKIGVDVAIEALKLYRSRLPVKVDDIMRYARVCRVANVMRPYLEAIL